VAVEDLAGEAIAVTGHRDGASLDRAVADLFDELQVAPKLVRAAAGPALHATAAGNEILVVTTAPDALPAGVVARALDSRRMLAFELLVRDQMPSPALAAFIELAAVVERPAAHRALAAVA
jgi:hypothetical protein